MNSLSNELKAVISRRLAGAGSREVLAIASALCVEEAADEQAQANGQENVWRQPPEVRPRFEVYVGSDTVLDNSTGLLWTRSNVPGGRMTWPDAGEACSKLELGGYTDWRLPSIRELLTLVDYDKHDPAIDTDIFNCEAGWYWTGTPAAPSPGDCAWFVFFSYGNAAWYSHDGNGFVRAVRASQ